YRQLTVSHTNKSIRVPGRGESSYKRGHSRQNLLSISVGMSRKTARPNKELFTIERGAGHEKRTAACAAVDALVRESIGKPRGPSSAEEPIDGWITRAANKAVAAVV